MLVLVDGDFVVNGRKTPTDPTRAASVCATYPSCAQLARRAPYCSIVISVGLMRSSGRGLRLTPFATPYTF